MPTRVENKACVPVCVSVRVQTHTSSDAVSLNSSSCCHRHFFARIASSGPRKNSAGRLVCKLIMGEMGACVTLPLSITHFLPFSIPLAIYPFLLSSCLPFPARIPLTSASIEFPHECGQEEMTLWVSLNLASLRYFPQGSRQCEVCVEPRIVLCPILDLYFLPAADAVHCSVTTQRLGGGLSSCPAPLGVFSE